MRSQLLSLVTIALVAGCATQAPQTVDTNRAVTPSMTTGEISTPAAVESFRAKAPVPAAPRPYRFPEVTRRTLDNRMRLLVAPAHASQMVSVRVIVRSGAYRDPSGRAGLATLTADMLDEGAGARTPLQIADAIGNLGATLFSTADWDSSTVGLDILSSNLEQGMPVLADVVMRPAFAQKEFDRVLRERLTTLVQQKDQASIIASNRFAGYVFRGTPYENPLLGSEPTVRALTRKDVQSFYRSNYVPNNVSFIVTGDITPEHAAGLVTRFFSGWRRGKELSSVAVSPATVPASRIYLIDRPQSVQSQILIGHPGVARSNPDYFSILTLNTLLGGLFGSRINLNLREKHGYTYGSRSTFAFRREAGPFFVTAPVRNAVTSESITEILAELRRIRTGDVSDAELAQAKNYQVGAFPATVQSTGNLADRLRDLEVYDLPSDYFDQYRERIGAVTKEDVTRVASKYINPDQVAIVVVGKASDVREALSKLGPPMALYDIEGKPVTR